MKKRSSILAITLPMLSLLALASCGSGGQKTEKATADSLALAAASAKPVVQIEQVSSQSVDQTFDYTANIQANVVNNIAPAMSLRIEQINAEVGDMVQAGQILAKMDPTNLIQAQTQLANLQVEFNRVDELYKVGGVSKSEWDSRKTALEVSEASYENVKDNTSLESPISGIVTARNYDSGDMYSAGGGRPVLVVEQIAPVKVIINVSEAQFKDVRKGMEVDIRLDVYPDDLFKGRVSLVYPTIDQASRTFPVEIEIPNTDRRVRPGMFARVVMTFGTADHVVAPDRAIIKQAGSGDRYTYVYKDGKVSYQKVELGRRLGESYEVISGVSNGDQVVVTGQSRLNNGMEVEIEKVQ